MTDIPFYIIIIASSLVILSQLIVYYRFRGSDNRIGSAFAQWKLTMVWVIVFLIALWMFLPSAHNIRYFAYPESISDIQNESKMLRILQRQNQDLATTLTILNWFLFILIWMFLVPTYEIIKTILNTGSVTLTNKPEQNEGGNSE